MQILLADDDSKVRSALKFILEQDPDAVVTGEVEETEELLEKISKLLPDVILLDWELPGLISESLIIKKIKTLQKDVQVIALSGDTRARKSAIKSGAVDFICKSDPPEKLLNAIEHSRKT